jgi:hypothetical protein
MKTLKIHKSWTPQDNATTIEILHDINEIQGCAQVKEAFQIDAEALADALRYSLPAGTWNRLLIRMMEQATEDHREALV